MLNKITNDARGAIKIEAIDKKRFKSWLASASARDRTWLKTLGFSGPQVLALVLGESCLLALLGGGIGFALGYLFVSFGDPTHGALPIFFIPTGQIALGIGLILLLGLLTGALPAFQAMRLRIVDALRRN